MDNISINVANRLYWLGRYTERAYTLIAHLRKLCDRMVDKDENAYKEFCKRLGIADNYNGKNHFIQSFLSDKDSGIGIASSLEKAYDNAVVLRDKLTSQTLSYIQLASNDLAKCLKNDCRVFELQKVTDNLVAFWGAIDDYILENNIRDIIKAGKYAERMDLYARFGTEESKLMASAERLSRYMKHLEIDWNGSRLYEVIAVEGALNYNAIEGCIGELFKSEVVQ